ncbi:phosphoribosyltransferase family protein [Ramlibacter tataouinensis]|uniref:phosphoribosyltransferase n=1 Tax=Ramlibacter tataouinensis TaxID=94132 RepID=UPI0022F37E60|nr:phosphoribosyltransferase family protein [Ramlibacter tataouinensis]WBY02138.1 phosphoribosyltransferase family protein [Ramlibacter tataouinensis]
MADLPYRDRSEAGRVLATRLAHWRGAPGLLVLGLPRGGVPVAAEVAHALAAPLDVFVVRKLGYPGAPEVAMGAIASGGVRVVAPLPGMPVDPVDVERVAARELEELQRRELLYRGGRLPLQLAGRSVIVVDDGLATGASLLAAARAVRSAGPLRLCAAVPVGSSEGCELVRPAVDELVCPAIPMPFRAVSLWYRHFPQTSDAEVRSLLARAGPAP